MHRKTFRWGYTLILAAAILYVGISSGCSVLPFSSGPTPPPNTLAYDAPISLSVKSGAILPGTNISYGGKMSAGAGRVLIGGQAAPKQVGDSLDWEGSPVPNVKLRLSTRVATFDDQSITLIGTAHIEIANVTVQTGASPGAALLEFSAPVTYSLAKNGLVPGSKVVYVGASPDGAQFLGLEGYPYRKQLDSLQHSARVNPKVFLQLDLRVLNFSDANVILGGKADIRIER